MIVNDKATDNKGRRLSTLASGRWKHLWQCVKERSMVKIDIWVRPTARPPAPSPHNAPSSRARDQPS